VDSFAFRNFAFISYSYKGHGPPKILLWTLGWELLGYALYMRYEIRNVASAQEWDFTVWK